MLNNGRHEGLVPEPRRVGRAGCCRGRGRGCGRFQQRSRGAISGNAEAIVGAVIAVAIGVGGVAAVVGRVKVDSKIGKK